MAKPIGSLRDTYSLERKAIFMRLKRQVREAHRYRKDLKKGKNADPQARNARLRLDDYDPLVEIALIGMDLELPESLRLQCHMAVAPYVYPKVTPEVQIEAGEAGITLVIQKFMPAEPKQLEQVVDADFKKAAS